MSFMTEAQIEQRIKSSTAFLEHARTNMINNIRMTWVEIGLSSTATSDFQEDVPEDAIEARGYSVFTLKEGTGITKFILETAMPAMAVGNAGSIFTNIIKWNDKDYKVTLNNFNPIVETGNKAFYFFDVCSLEDF